MFLLKFGNLGRGACIGRALGLWPQPSGYAPGYVSPAHCQS
jgi:hypothetical protein